MGKITRFLGGRVSGERVFKEIKDGAYGGLEKGTKIGKEKGRSIGM